MYSSPPQLCLKWCMPNPLIFNTNRLSTRHLDDFRSPWQVRGLLWINIMPWNGKIWKFQPRPGVDPRVVDNFYPLDPWVGLGEIEIHKFEKETINDIFSIIVGYIKIAKLSESMYVVANVSSVYHFYDDLTDNGHVMTRLDPIDPWPTARDQIQPLNSAVRSTTTTVNWKIWNWIYLNVSRKLNIFIQRLYPKPYSARTMSIELCTDLIQ